MLTPRSKPRRLIISSACALIGGAILMLTNAQALQSKPLQLTRTRQNRSKASVANAVAGNMMPAEFANSPLRKLFTEKFKWCGWIKDLPASVQPLCADMSDDISQFDGGIFVQSGQSNAFEKPTFKTFFEHAFASDDFVAVVTSYGGCFQTTHYAMRFFNIEVGKASLVADADPDSGCPINDIARVRSLASSPLTEWSIDLPHRRRLYTYEDE